MRRRTWWALLVMFALAAAACGDDTGGDLPAPADDVVLRVIVGDEIGADWTLETLEGAVPFTSMTIDGDEQSGPLLLDVLAASDVGSWTSLEVLGMGEGRTFTVNLEVDRAEVDDGWILDVSKRGTLKLAAEDLAREQWVRDVAEIHVR